ncbi:MAG TPA: hypothetical protein VJQ79_14415, partial [Acidimicrobiia bacterium]|nr:hypothetical protein [Acidimicrobiia bacterium]
QGRYLILRRIRREGGGMKLLALSTSGRVVPIGVKDLPPQSAKAATLELPKPFAPRDRRFQQDALRLMRRVPAATHAQKRATAGQGTDSAPRPGHPVAGCPDLESHLRAARRAHRTRNQIDQLTADLRQSGVGLVEDFQSIIELLADFGYLSGWTLTDRGNRLRFIYNELDLLLAEALERGMFWNLSVPELVALASGFVYEPRTDERLVPVWPTAALADRWADLEKLWEELVLRERAARLPPTRRPDPGFALLAYEWAEGGELDDLPSLRLQPGDFVRVSRQLVDLLKQLRDVSPELAAEARAALIAVDRGVVAAMGVG